MRITAQGVSIDVTAMDLEFLKTYAPEVFAAIIKFIAHTLELDKPSN